MLSAIPVEGITKDDVGRAKDTLEFSPIQVSGPPHIIEMLFTQLNLSAGWSLGMAHTPYHKAGDVIWKELP